MFGYSRLSRRATLAVVLGVTTVSAAGAATFHRLATTGTTGSEGAVATLQTSATGSAIQGEVAASTNTAVKYPFGVLGEYNAAGSTFGIGLIGLSTTGYAIGGESLSSNQPSIIAYPGGNGMGLEALTQSSSSSPAIYAQSKGTGNGLDAAITNGNAVAGVLGEDLSGANAETDGVLGTTLNGGFGVEGDSSDGAFGGVYGTATSGNGVVGEATSGDGMDGTSDTGSGVGGYNSATSSASPEPDGDDVGVYASSTIGDGVFATSTNANGVFAESMNGYGLSAESSMGAALYANSMSSNGAIILGGGPADEGFTTTTLVLDSQSTGDLILALSSTGCGLPPPYSQACLDLDSEGNLYLSGTETSQGTASRTRNPNSDLVSYGDEVTEPTIEDVGRAQLVNGSAFVPLATDYRQTIDSPQYLVFLTPHGDCNGLYIASETASGFVVRESHGGRSTLGFDYRMVAQQYGAHEGRLPHYSKLHPNQRKLELAAIAHFARAHPSERVGAEPRRAIWSMKKQQALKLAHDRHRFVPPPVTFMPQAASFSVR